MNDEPHFPNRSDVEVPLLRAIDRRGGSIRLSRHGRDLEIELAEELGITAADRDFAAPNYNSEGHRKWRNEIQFVREKLVKKGDLNGSVRDVWTLTPAGKARVLRNSN